jgi:phenylacetate-CoA ligase
VHATSGTKGRPTIAAYTEADLGLFRNVNARALAAAGAAHGTVVHNAYGYGLFTGGLGLHGGAEHLGCAVVPISGGQTARQVVLVRDLQPEVLCCTPSYAALLGEALQEAGVTPEENPFRVGIFGAEPWTEQLRLRIETLHALTALDIYGLCEVIGPGVAFECLESRAELADGGIGGLPVNEDPLTGEPVADGEIGELVFTTLTKEALPFVRYRTGDLASLNRERCACGRTTVRMSRLVGRSDDMLVIRGVNVFPSEIEAAVLSSPQLAPHYTIVLDSTGPMPEMIVVCELADTWSTGDAADLAHELSARLSERLGVSGRVVVGPPGALPRSEVGKAVRLVRRTPDADGRPAELARLMDSPA